MTDLDLVLRRWAADADALRRNGDPSRADLLERCVREATEAAHEWLTWIPEEDAMLRSGHSREWWLAAFRRLQPRGHARQVGRGKRVYRLAVVPVRKALLDAAEDGRRTARALGAVA